MFNDIYRGKSVLITGHTGFKGSWLSLWLKELGADVVGYALDPPSEPNHWNLLNLNMPSVIGDVRDRKKLLGVFETFRPEVVFHLAAQPLVIDSYIDPIGTYETNIIGTVNILDACRHVSSARAVIIITSDKCYENKEWVWGYRENDSMGGYDPYSCSKGCAELITTSYRNSFFNVDKFGKDHHTLLASVRAGNAIGGGDWEKDRLIPDIMRAVSSGDEVVIRNPHSTRPWQHVLDPLSGYLKLGQRLLEGNVNFAEGWNFGPNEKKSITVGEVVAIIHKNWPVFAYRAEKGAKSEEHEANLLRLDCSKATIKLKWKCLWDAEEAFLKTTEWYKGFYQKGKITSSLQLSEYVKRLTQTSPESK